MKGIIYSVCVIMLGVWGEMAVAAGPFYQVGNNAAKGLAEIAWENLGRDCNKIDVFTQIVEDSIRDAARDIRTRYRGRSAKDFGTGYQDGLSSVLDRVGQKCRSENAKTLLKQLKQLLVKLFKAIIIVKPTMPDQPKMPEKHQKPAHDYGWSYGGYEPSYYRIAYNAANGLTRVAWDSLGRNCRMTSQFVEIVGYGVDDVIADIGTRYTGWAAEQFGRGYIDGLVDTLERLVNLCENECGLFGNAMGEWSAKLFCPIAKEIGKAPKFTSRLANIRGKKCGNAYGSECESGFVDLAKASCPKYTRSGTFKDYYSSDNKGCCAYHSY